MVRSLPRGSLMISPDRWKERPRSSVRNLEKISFRTCEATIKIKKLLVRFRPRPNLAAGPVPSLVCRANRIAYLRDPGRGNRRQAKPIRGPKSENGNSHAAVDSSCTPREVTTPLTGDPALI